MIRVEDVSDVTRPSRATARPPSSRRTHEHAARTPVIVSISRRASRGARPFGRARGSRLRSPPRPSARRTGNARWRSPSVLTPARRHSRPRARRARSPTLRRAPRARREALRACGARPGGDPGPIDRCLQLTIRFSRRTPTRHGTLRVDSPRRGSPRFTPMGSLRRAGDRPRGVLFLATVSPCVPLTLRRCAGSPAERCRVHRLGPQVARGDLGSYPRA